VRTGQGKTIRLRGIKGVSMTSQPIISSTAFA
jgi:hypothetical protein